MLEKGQLLPDFCINLTIVCLAALRNLGSVLIKQHLLFPLVPDSIYPTQIFTIVPFMHLKVTVVCKGDMSYNLKRSYYAFWVLSFIVLCSLSVYVKGLKKSEKAFTSVTHVRFLKSHCFARYDPPYSAPTSPVMRNKSAPENEHKYTHMYVQYCNAI